MKKLYYGILKVLATENIEWEFEAENDEEAMAIVDKEALETGYTVVEKKLYLIGKRIA